MTGDHKYDLQKEILDENRIDECGKTPALTAAKIPAFLVKRSVPNTNPKTALIQELHALVYYRGTMQTPRGVNTRS